MLKISLTTFPSFTKEPLHGTIPSAALFLLILNILCQDLTYSSSQVQQNLGACSPVCVDLTNPLDAGYWSSRSAENPKIGVCMHTITIFLSFFKIVFFLLTMIRSASSLASSGGGGDRTKRAKEKKPPPSAENAKERKSSSSKKKRRPTEVNPWVEKRPKSKSKKKKNKIPKVAPAAFIPGPLLYGTLFLLYINILIAVVNCLCHRTRWQISEGLHS